MSQSRREFLITLLCGIALWRAGVPPAVTGRPARSLNLLEGDPYTAHVDEHGLGGRTWDSARDHAQRFRSTPADRDRYVLGLEI